MIEERPAQQLNAQENPADNWYKALNLQERLALLQAQPGEHTSDHARALRRLERWKKQYPFSKEDYFNQRLHLNKVVEEDLVLLLGEPPLHIQHPDMDLPFKPDLLFQILESQTKQDIEEILFSGSIQAVNVTPLVSIVLPFVKYGEKRIQDKIASFSTSYTYLPFDEETILPLLTSGLAQQLLAKMYRVLALELNIARLQERIQGTTSEERFQDFCLQLCQEGALLKLLELYPPLGRILVETIERYVDFYIEALEHLCLDWPTICSTFSKEGDPGPVIKIDGGIGDTHRGGRSVLKFACASGFQMIYKPRSLQVEVHFQQLLEWFNAKGWSPTFKALTVLDRGTHGWCEFVSAQSCTQPEEVARFYERQGGYLGLLYCLDATDLHFENLIASGEHPFIIDLESLFQPRLQNTSSAQQPNTLPLNIMSQSVLRIGLLPTRIAINQEYEGIDISGLGGTEGQLTPFPVLQWEGVGTDQMRLTRQRVPMPGQHNRPLLNGLEADVLAYSEHIITGFARIYRIIMQHREDFIAGPLQIFKHDEIRVIVRNTRRYAELLHESYHPDLLRDGLDRDRFFDHLWREVEQLPCLASLITAEAIDLHAGDIPLFTTHPNSRDVYSSQGVRITEFLGEPSMDYVKKGLDKLDEQDLARQCWFIQASLSTIPLGDEQARWKGSQLQSVQRKVQREQLLQFACNVGDRLCEQAIRQNDEITWIGINLLNERQWMVLPIGLDLYSGQAGIALFLAYLGDVTRKNTYTLLARKIVNEIIRIFKRPDTNISQIGAFEGYGAFIYLLSHLGHLWHEPDLFREAHEIVKLLPDLIEQDTFLDIIGGTAGCITALNSLYQVSPSSEIIATMLLCGEKLLAHVQPVNGAGIAWEHKIIPTRKPLTGFSHGVAGIALSLFEVAALSGEERFHQTALKALEYERSAFSEERHNWPDLRDLKHQSADQKNPPSEQTYMTTWCHGAPGIALGRLAALAYHDDATMRDEIRIALHTTVTQGFGLNHSLCHGDLGNLDAILTASQILHNKQYVRESEHLSAAILDSIERLGWSTGIPMGVETPGLMCGIAGIGYELLRIADPQKVPSVLYLAPPV